MAFATLSLVLALFCGIVSASWGPSNLTTRVDSSKGDFVDINARWNPGRWPCTHIELYSESPEQLKTEEASTSDPHYTIVNKEFWTNYTVILETSWCFDEPLQTQIFTGPGNPHKVESVKTASSALEANVTITEAFMPRPVDGYNITWCSSPADCQTQVFARENHAPATTFNVTLKELRPETVYNLTVVPEILFEGKPFRGSEFTSKLVTKQIQLPVPTNVETSFPWGEEEHQEVELSWTLGDTPYELAYYTVNITCEDDPTFKRSQRVETPETIFGDMPNSAKLTARITPIFNISKNLMHHDGAITTFTTPPPAPEPTNFAFVPLGLTSIFAHWNTVPEVPQSDLSFDFAYTDPKNKTTALTVNGTSVLVENLAADTTYRVVISLISKLRQPHFMEKEFSTLAEDYAAPASVNMEPMTETTQEMWYNMTWTTIDHPAKASRFQVEVCHRDSTGCTRNETGGTNMVLPLNFFGNFSITVSAIYDLSLNQTQVRPAHALTMETPGVEPSEVTNITLQNVTATNAVLRWIAPANIPENISKIYEVFDAENNLTDQTTTEQIQLVNLSPFSLYNINIQATVLYNKTEYSGNKTFFRFYTDSAAPGAPETVKVEQIVRTNVFKVSWTPPRVMNGKLDYYEVLTKDESGDVVSNLTNLTGTSGVTVVLPLAHSDAVYNVSVRAVNVNLEGESLPGNVTESVLLFKGIAPPTAEVVKRRSDSLILKVTPSNATEDTTGLFFTIKNGNNSFPSDSDHIEVNHLSAYTNETMDVYACYLPTFCSEAFTIIELTNVDGPSPVNDLEGNFINRTIPFFNWTAPTLLNGPLNGYLVNLRDLSNSSLDIKKVLPADQTSFVYETSMEFEKYTFAVSGFNYDLDEKEARVVGAISNVRVNTTGEHPPKPENVREVNKTSTSFSIEWEKPQYADFNVSFYHVVVPSLGTDEMTNETQITLSGLKPWTNTKVEASGCTDDNVTTCGFAGSYSIWTGVANPSQPHSIEFTDVTKTEAMVSWKAPLTPNGPINGYKIAVSMTDNQNLTWDEVTEGAASHHFSNLTAETKYTLHLLAYNIEDSTGEELLSPPSIVEFSTAGSGGFAWWIVVVALVVIAAGAAIGVVVYKRRNAQGEDRERLVQA